MKNLRLLLLFLSFPVIAFSQEEAENTFMVETEVGIIMHSSAATPMNSLQLSLGPLLNEWSSCGLFFNGYTATGSSPGSSGYAPIPHGARAGIFGRAFTTGDDGHFHAEARGSIGKIFQTGLLDHPDPDRAREFLFGVNFGYNFHIANDAYFGLAFGIEAGSLKFEDPPDLLLPPTRFNVGLRIQKRF